MITTGESGRISSLQTLKESRRLNGGWKVSRTHRRYPYQELKRPPKRLIPGFYDRDDDYQPRPSEFPKEDSLRAYYDDWGWHKMIYLVKWRRVPLKGRTKVRGRQYQKGVFANCNRATRTVGDYYEEGKVI
jgi:hypothetical protein